LPAERVPVAAAVPMRMALESDPIPVEATALIIWYMFSSREMNPVAVPVPVSQ
jgi:hypothetical protein